MSLKNAFTDRNRPNLGDAAEGLNALGNSSPLFRCGNGNFSERFGLNVSNPSEILSVHVKPPEPSA